MASAKPSTMIYVSALPRWTMRIYIRLNFTTVCQSFRLIAFSFLVHPGHHHTSTLFIPSPYVWTLDEDEEAWLIYNQILTFTVTTSIRFLELKIDFMRTRSLHCYPFHLSSMHIQTNICFEIVTIYSLPCFSPCFSLLFIYIASLA